MKKWVKNVIAAAVASAAGAGAAIYIAVKNHRKGHVIETTAAELPSSDDEIHVSEELTDETGME